MNTVNQALVIELLTRARASLWNGEGKSVVRHTYVCIEVERAYQDLVTEGPKTPEYLREVFAAAEYIKDQINSYIDGIYTYDRYWARKNGIDAEASGFSYAEFQPAIQIGRAAMIDALIERAQTLAILKLASTRIWDGVDASEEGDTNSEYMCIAISNAAVDVLSLRHLDNFSAYSTSVMAANKLPVVAKLHNDINEMIGGCGTARGYYRKICHANEEVFTDVKLQAFRKNHLESMLTTYIEKAVK